MAEIQIKNSTLPVRCEVCHQADCYDQNTNFCARCADIKRTSEISSPKTRTTKPAITTNEIDNILDQRDELLKDLDIRIPLVTSLFGFIFCTIFLGDLHGGGFAGFLGFGIVIGLIIGAALTAAYVLYKKLARIIYPLTDRATRERYQRWKEEREIDKLKMKR